jgi:1,2-diacylglycerol 3-beta-galactosyltransferase
VAARVTTRSAPTSMIEVMPEIGPDAERVPLLFLVADTGGGHRNAALAVGQALERIYPGRFAPVLCDPLGGASAAPLLRFVAGLYGPATRLVPWLWGAAYHVCDSRPAMRVLRRTLLRLADRPAAEAAAAHRPAAVVSFHPLTGSAAVAASRAAPGAPAVTVVTDLARMHAAWRYPGDGVIIAPRQPGRDGSAAVGLPVTREFWGGPLRGGERAILRRSLGLREDAFLVLVTGGGEGSGGIAARTAAVLRRFPDVGVVAVCGRNRRLKRRLDRLAASSGCAGRLTVTGFTRHMADWLRACDLVVSKAGPGTIAEAACCGAAMLLTSHLPGQETGNTEIVTRAGAGRRARSVRALLTEIDGLMRDRDRMEAMRAASARIGQPAAAADVAELIAGLVTAVPTPHASARSRERV